MLSRAMEPTPDRTAVTPIRRRAGLQGGRTPAPARPILGRLAVALVRAAGKVPLAVAHRIGAAVGWWLAVLPTPARRVTDVNLAIAFPERSARDRRALATRSLVETGRTMAELGAWWTWDAGAVDRRIAEVRGEEHLTGPLAEGRGVLLILPHLGSWELFGPFLSSRRPLTALYRAPRVRELDAFFRASRERHGARLVPADLGAARALLRGLRRGETVAILPDQDAGHGAGVFVPFFGEPANTMTLLPKLAHRSGAAVVIASALRREGDRRHVVTFRTASEAIADPDEAVGAAAMNREIESAVRDRPEQYLWSYRRYRIRPAGSDNPYRRRGFR